MFCVCIFRLIFYIFFSSNNTSTPLSGHENNSFVYIDIPSTSKIGEQKKQKLTTNTENFNLEFLLNEHCMGRALLNIYELKKSLDSRSQSYLVDIISTHILNGEYS